MSSINLQTPIIYPCVVFSSIRIVTIKDVHVQHWMGNVKVTRISTITSLDFEHGKELHSVEGEAL